MKSQKINIFTFVVLSLVVSFVRAEFIGKGCQDGENPYFVIVIPSYNNEKYCENNLKSALGQSYPYYEIIYINDASTDKTKTKVIEYIAQHDVNKQITFIDNKNNVGPLANIYKTVHMCDSHAIIVILDGDDFLIDNNVLKYLADVYQDRDVWMTYGQYLYYYPYNQRTIKGEADKVPHDIIKNNSFREYRWVTSHLRTFYAGLFQKIKKEDLCYNGEFFTMATDLAAMFPMLEMAGKHSKFISKPLYLYNIENPLNANKKNRKLQSRLDKFIRQKTRYKLLNLW